MSHNDNVGTFFECEHDMLAREVTSVNPLCSRAIANAPSINRIEELLSSTNGLNRKLEEVLGMTREYDTIAALWRSFQLMRNSGSAINDTEDTDTAQGGLPGTGTHVVAARQSQAFSRSD